MFRQIRGMQNIQETYNFRAGIKNENDKKPHCHYLHTQHTHMTEYTHGIRLPHRTATFSYVSVPEWGDRLAPEKCEKKNTLSTFERCLFNFET